MFNFGNFLFENFTDNEDSEALSLIENELDSVAEEALTSGKYDDIEDTSSDMANIFLEASNESYKLYASLLATDIVMENWVKVGELEKADKALEGAIKTFFDKMKEMFTSLWGKITKFFSDAKKKLNEFFDMGAKFIAKNENTIKNNSSKYSDMEYEGYKYPEPKRFMPSGIFSAIEKEISSVSNDSGKIVDAIVKAGADKAGDSFKGELAKYEDMTVEKILTGSLKSEVSKYGGDVKDNASLKKSYRIFIRGSEEKVKLTGKTGPNIDTMINFVKNRNNSLSGLEKIYNDLKKTFAVIIKSFDGAASKAKSLLDTKDKDRIGKVQQICTKASAGYRSYLSIATSIYSVSVEELKIACAQFMTILKKLSGGKGGDSGSGDNNSSNSSSPASKKHPDKMGDNQIKPHALKAAEENLLSYIYDRM